MVNRDTHLNALETAAHVVITDHALEKGFNPNEVRETVETLAGAVYLDTGSGRYHLVTEDMVIVVAVRDTTRVIITVYPNDGTPKHQQDQYILLRG